jgi:hypothetical protein
VVRYLFDLGTSHYNTSLQWITDRYAKTGVDFDEIWAWEVSNEVKAWAAVMRRLMCRDVSPVALHLTATQVLLSKSLCANAACCKSL